MSERTAVKEKKGICGICSAGCWIIAEYDAEGRIVHVRPDMDSPMKMICRLGEHSPEIIYSPHRLHYPMRRRGKKGNYEFDRISWDEAFSEIVERLQTIKREDGPEACGIYTGVGTFEHALCDVFQPKGVAISSASSVLFPFGSPNTMGVGALCYVSYGMIAPHLTMGKMLFEIFNDIENSELIVVWGTNPATDLPPIDMKRILEARQRGAEVVVIDPRRTMTVKRAEAEWIPIRPGTDGALALGLCNVIIQEELYDEKFVEEWTLGFDDFAAHVQHYRPEVVESITGVPADTVVSLARRLASARGVSQLMYTGMEYSSSGVQAIRASLVLWALAGQLDVPGGRCFLMNGSSFPINRDGLIANPDTGTRIGRDRFPLYVKYRDEAHAIGLPESVLEGKPYRIRSLIIQGASITTSWPNPELWKKTLSALDFLVCIDRQFTADCAYADIVLPAATYYEVESYMTYGSLFKIRERMIDPVGESRGDFWIMAELARRLGYGELYPQNERELFDYVLQGSGFTYEDVAAANGTVSGETALMEYRKWEKGLLREDGKPGFDTPSRKFEIGSMVLEEYGYDPLPVYTEPREGPLSRPDLVDRYPLIFNSGSRMRTSFHTQHRGIDALIKETPEPLVTLNTEDARDRGIEHGDMVRISTLRGSVVMRARVTDDIVQGAIDANHASGSPVGPDAWQSGNINQCTDLEQYDPISGFPVYKSLLCNVEKVRDGNGALIIGSGESGSDDLTLDKAEIKEKEIYCDHNATTPLSPEVRQAMEAVMDTYGNPSSIHSAGRRSRKVIDTARRSVSSALNTTSRRIVFTSSGSGADNLAIKGAAFAAGKGKDHLITSAVEHPAVLETCRWLETQGFAVTYCPVDSAGVVDMDALKGAVTHRTFLISVMTANNETGTLQPIKEIADIANAIGVLFHTDAVQAFGKVPVDIADLGVDLLSISAHKIYGPKGIGALFVKKGVALEPLISGGGHEYGLKSGTENIIGMAGFGRAADMVPVFLRDMERVRGLRDQLEEGVAKIVPDYRLNGDRNNRLPNTLNVTLPGFRGESLVLALDRRSIYFSSGSACASGSPGPSHTLLAMGLSEEDAHCALRFSLGIENTREDIDRVISLLDETIRESRSMIHFVPCR